MPLAPEILAFGDGNHEAGTTGLTISGGGFGAFAGTAWIYQNADRTGNVDQLTIGAWNDLLISGVEIPVSPSVPSGTRYLFVQREDLAWSQGFMFELDASDVLFASVSEITVDGIVIGVPGTLIASELLAYPQLTASIAFSSHLTATVQAS